MNCSILFLPCTFQQGSSASECPVLDQLHGDHEDTVGTDQLHPNGEDTLGTNIGLDAADQNHTKLCQVTAVVPEISPNVIEENTTSENHVIVAPEIIQQVIHLKSNKSTQTNVSVSID